MRALDFFSGIKKFFSYRGETMCKKVRKETGLYYRLRRSRYEGQKTHCERLVFDDQYRRRFLQRYVFHEIFDTTCTSIQ